MVEYWRARTESYTSDHCIYICHNWATDWISRDARRYMDRASSGPDGWTVWLPLALNSVNMDAYARKLLQKVIRQRGQTIHEQQLRLMYQRSGIDPSYGSSSRHHNLKINRNRSPGHFKGFITHRIGRNQRNNARKRIETCVKVREPRWPLHQIQDRQYRNSGSMDLGS